MVLTGPGEGYSRAAIWKAWIPSIIWLGIIALESTSVFSAANTGRFLYPLLHFLFGVDPFRFITWHFFLRKTGHVIGYGVLSLLLFRAWRATVHVAAGNPRWSIAWARMALGMNSAVMVSATGISPPRPKLERKRKTPSDSMFQAAATRPLNAAKMPMVAAKAARATPTSFVLAISCVNLCPLTGVDSAGLKLKSIHPN